MGDPESEEIDQNSKNETDDQANTENGTKSKGDIENEDEVELERYPVGASREAEAKVASGVESELNNGIISELFSDHDPDDLNNLIQSMINDYKENTVRKLRYQFGVLLLSVIFVLGLFAGLMYFVLETGRNGTSLIFFAGTLTGYFMRLASDKF